MSSTLNINDTFGTFLIGVVVSATLFGMICIQTFSYFQNYGTDNSRVKLFVSALFVFGGLHSALSTHAIYYYTIINYRNPIALLDSIWSLTTILQLSGTIRFVVHIFFIRRVYYVSRKNLPLAVVVFILALAHCGTTIVLTYRAFRSPHFYTIPQLIPYMNAALSLSMAADIIIAGSLSYFLHKTRSGIKKTDTMINKLIIYAVNNGILTR
ncbi:hypothetical protein BDZ94DRAFT_1310611 [Collybia nuda]|uniref:DUF6534 domain-containing protein n=1 Tax=Collybia nuda TaxID=64659 RepID=A0A9P6CI12_9AGAR|nr:hypothetical protein BDZ94DRAFT_1310611 [Collybia nuda]